MRGETDFIIKEGKIEQIYRCSSQTYWISEHMCDARQVRKYRQCSTCSVRKGGKNDPRKTIREVK